MRSMRALALISVLLAADTAYDAVTLDMPTSVARLFATGRWDHTPVGFRIVALSFIADACVARSTANEALKAAALACVDRAIALARLNHPRPITSETIWLAHFALLLGAREQLGSCVDEDLHTKVARELADRTAHEPTSIPPSYSGRNERYPADQAALLAALVRYDKRHEADLASAPAERFDTYLREHATDPTTKLPFSEVSGTPSGRFPRGCALSWQTRYLAEALPERAKSDWAIYEDLYLVDTGLLVGFREWPPGVDRAADVDSGPIVHGVGAAATALAMAAARTMSESTLAARIEATDSMVTGVAHHDGRVADEVHSLIADAIRYIGHAAMPR